MDVAKLPTIEQVRALQDISKDKPKKRAKQPKKKLPQKKRSSALKNRTRVNKDVTNLAHITKAIVREGGTVPDVAMILACQEIENGEQWLEELKEQDLSIEEFLQVAKNRVDIDLIRAAVKASTGYSYEEETDTFITGDDETLILDKRSVKKKKQSADTALLWNILRSRMPDYFNDTKHIEINKRVVEVKEEAQAEIRGLCKGLLESLGETVEAEFVDRELL